MLRFRGMKGWFFITWPLVFAVIFFALYGLRFVPGDILMIGEELAGRRGYNPQPVAGEKNVPAGNYTVGEPRIIIESIGLDSAIIFQSSSDLAVLNESLLKGVVHFPKSAFPGQDGTVLIFGHSTTKLPAKNKNYAVFNHLKDLERGDVVKIQSGDQEYRYSVLSVVLKKASEAEIDLESATPKLILSTCNVLGRKEERFVVEAEFMGSSPIATPSQSETSS